MRNTAPDRTFEGVILWRINKAVHFAGHYWEGALWFPMSQITVLEDGEGHVIKVSDWLASKRGIDEFTFYDEAAITEFNEK